MALALLIAAPRVLSAPQPHPAPSADLEQANTARARALALDAALIKGWNVSSQNINQIVFTTRLTEIRPSINGEPTPIPLQLRIRADFSPEGHGVRVTLHATEIHFPGSPSEREFDVTAKYHQNLSNALDSLRIQWQDLALHGTLETSLAAGKSGSQQKNRRGQSALTVPHPIGQWSYEAERAAQDQGCLLDERGAFLLEAARRDGAGREHHRVPCRNRSPMLVICDGEGCRKMR